MTAFGGTARARAIRLVLSAVLAAGTLACGALLDLNVQYVGDGGLATVDASSDAGTPPSPPDGAMDVSSPPPPDATAEVLDAADDGAVNDGAADASPVAIQFVQVNAGQADPGGSSALIAFPGAVSAGDTIVVAADYDTTAALQITDTLGTVYGPAIGPLANGTQQTVIWYGLATRGGPDTVTISLAMPPSNFLECYVHEYAGIASLDVVAGQNGTAQLMESGYATTTAPGDLIFGYGVTGAATPGTGFTIRSAFNANVTEDLIAGAPGPYEATAGTTSGWTMLMAAFKAR